MKKIFSILLLMSAGIHFTNAQSSVAIGDSNPKASAVLYLKGNGSQGLIIPIVANTTSIAVPESGMIVYNSSDKKVYYHDGAVWLAVGSGSAGGSAYTLSLLGNNLLLKDATSTVSTVPIAATAPTAANQFLTWDGSKWVATAFTQDAANVSGAITVNGIKGKTIPALPSTTQALVYNGSAWVFQPLTGSTDSQDLSLNTTTNALSLTNDATPVDLSSYKQTLSVTGNSLSISGGNAVALPAPGITSVTSGTGLTGGVITTTGTINVDVGTTANKIVQLDATGKLPAVDGSQLTNLAGGGDITGVTAGTGLTGGAASGNATLNVDAGTTANKIVQLDATGKLPAVDGSQLTNLPVGSGTVNNVSVTNANGFSGTVSNPTTAPAITLTTPVTGIIKGNGTSMSAAVAGTDYLTPTGSAAGLTGFPTLNQNTTGTASTITGNIAESQVTNLTTDLANKITGNTAITAGTNTKITYDAKGLVTAGAALAASDLPVMTSTVGGAVPTPPNNTTTFLRGDGTFATPAGGGTLTAVSVTTANGFSGTSSGGSTPALTITTPVTGIIKGNGTSMSAAVAGTDYLTPTGSAAGLTGFPTLNQNTTGTASTITGNITQTQVTNLTTDLANKVTGNTAITAGTNTKITYDAKGLVTGGVALAVSDLPVMTATAGGAVPTPPNNTTTFLRGDGTFAAPAGGGGGTVTDVSVVTANGVSGTVSTSTTTPALTLTLGAITPTNVAATGTVTGSNLSGTNTGDNAANSLYSGLVSNANHTGDATGATALQVRGINGVLLSGLTTGILKNTTGTGSPSIATGADLPVMTSTVGGAVPTPPNNTTTFLRGDGTFATPAGGGTLTAVSVTTANGFSGTSSGGATPALTLTTPVTGIIKGNGTAMSAAVAGTDYLAPTGSGAGLTALNATNIASGTLALARIAAGTNGDVLTTVGGVPTWQAPAVGASTLDALTDATVASPTTGQVLVNDGAGQFRNVSMSGDATINATGLVSLSAGSVSGGAGGKIVDASITSSDLANGSVSGGVGGVIADASITDADIASLDAAKITTGILPVSVGGTGRNTWDGLLIGSGANITDISNGTVGQVLTIVGTTPSWQTPISSAWGLTGNATTNPATNYVGTSDSQPLVFRTNAVEAMRVLTDGKVGIGIAAPTSKLDVVNATGIAIKATTNSNAANSYAVSGIHTGTGDVAGYFAATNTSGGVNSHGVYGQADGAGAGVFGASNGTASNAARFMNMNAGNANPVVQIFNSGTGASLTTAGAVGIATPAPSEKLHVEGNMLVNGTFGTGTLTTAGAGTRMFFYPTKAAFRAGQVIDVGGGEQTNWDDGQIGNYSFAGGRNTLANNVASFAAGELSRATGNSSVALGNTTVASRFASFAMGFDAQSNGEQAAAFGRGTRATATSSFAIGRYNVGSGDPVVVNGIDPIFEIGNGTSNVARSNALTVLKNGNVGIGIAVPTAKLDLVGAIKIVDGTQAVGRVLTSDAAGLASWQPAGAVGGWTVLGNAGTTFGTNFIGTTDNVGLSFKTNNLQRMYIDNAGRTVIDINNTNPIASPVANAILDIVPSGTGIGNIVLRGSNANPNDPVDIEFRNWGGTILGAMAMSTNGQDMLFSVAGTTRMTLENAGAVNFSGNTIEFGGTAILSNTGTANIIAGGNNNSAGDNSAFFGTGAGAANTADDNTFIGRNAGLVNFDGTLNVMVGSGSGQFTNSGSSNTFVGYRAGYTNTTGLRNVLIGREADVTAVGLTNAIAIGYQAKVSADNSMVLGGTGANAVNVGIGTATPHAQLQLASTIDNRKLVLYEATNNDHQFIGFGVEGSGALRYQTAANGNDHIFYTATSTTTSNELMRIRGIGNVGIGTPAPTSLLSVNGTADKVGGGAWGTFSDRRVKKDVHSFTDGLDVLMKFKPVQFKYNGLAGYSDDGKEYVGVIAQDVLPVAPYMISTVRTKLNNSDLNETDVLKYDASALTYVLVNSIKEQQAQIEELKNVIQILEDKLKAYQANDVSELAAIRAEIKKLSEAVGIEANAEKKK